MATAKSSRETIARRVEESRPQIATQDFRLQKIYVVATLLLMFGVLQLAVIKCVRVELIDSLTVPNFAWIFIALVCLLLMVFTELYNKFPINWTLSIVAVESVTLCSVSYKWSRLPPLYSAIILVGVVIIHIILYTMGACLPLLILPGYYAMLYLTIVFIVMYIFSNIVICALAMPNLLVIINLWGLLYMIPLILYTVTVIHQRRLPDMVSEEYIVSATIIASFFMFMVCLITNSVAYICRLIGGNASQCTIPYK